MARTQLVTVLRETEHGPIWKSFVDSIDQLSEGGFDLLLQFGPTAMFTIAVEDYDVDAAFALRDLWEQLSDSQFNDFLSAQAAFAPAPRLYESTVDHRLAAWFNSAMGSMVPQ